MDETVRVEFDPPRKCQKRGQAWYLTGDGVDPVWLPDSQTKDLEYDNKDEMLLAVTVPRWLAEKRGLVAVDCFQGDDSYQEKQTVDSMSRVDWFTLGIAMAMIIRGDLDDRNVLWEARKFAERMQETNE